MKFHIKDWYGRKVLLGWTLLAVACWSVAGCGKRADWQSYSDSTGRYVVDYPAKPSPPDNQTISVAGQSVTLRMQTATAPSGVSFAVGAVLLPEGADDAMRAAALDSMSSGMARYLPRAGAPQPVAIKDSKGQVLNGREWQSSDNVAGTSEGRHVVARFVASGARAYELVVVGDTSPSSSDLEKFLSSFTPD